MKLNRRMFLSVGALGAAGVTLSGCLGGEPDPTVLSVSAQGSSGMNPGADGADRPVTLNVVQMTGTGAFDSADLVALQDPASALGAEFVKAERLVLAPGGTASTSFVIDPRTTAIGVTGGFISPSGKVVRAARSAPAASEGMVISVGPGGITLS